MSSSLKGLEELSVFVSLFSLSFVGLTKTWDLPFKKARNHAFLGMALLQTIEPKSPSGRRDEVLRPKVRSAEAWCGPLPRPMGSLRTASKERVKKWSERPHLSSWCGCYDFFRSLAVRFYQILLSILLHLRLFKDQFENHLFFKTTPKKL